MNRSDSRACLAAIACIATVPVAAFFSATAKAEPDVDPVSQYTITNAKTLCSELDSNPTDDGMFTVLNHVLDAGFSAEDTAKIVVNSIAVWCPRNATVLDHFTGEKPGATSVIKPPITAGVYIA